MVSAGKVRFPYFVVLLYNGKRTLSNKKIRKSYFFSIIKMGFYMTEFNNTFMDRVESVLKERKWTQKEMAESLGLRRPTLSDWKKNGAVPAGDIALKIADYLNVSIEWLICGKEDGLNNEERWLLSQWKSLDAVQKDTVRTLLEKWESDRTAFEKKESEA